MKFICEECSFTEDLLNWLYDNYKVNNNGNSNNNEIKVYPIDKWRGIIRQDAFYINDLADVESFKFSIIDNNRDECNGQHTDIKVYLTSSGEGEIIYAEISLFYNIIGKFEKEDIYIEAIYALYLNRSLLYKNVLSKYKRYNELLEIEEKYNKIKSLVS